VEELPGKIIAFLQHTPLIARSGLDQEDKTQSGLEKVVILLRAQTGHDFSLYRRPPSTAGLSGAWASTRFTGLPAMSASCRRIPGTGSAVQGASDRGNKLFRDPRRGNSWKGRSSRRSLPGVRPVRRCGPGVPGCSTGRRLFPGHRLQRGVGATHAGQELYAPDLRDRPGPDAIEKAREGVFAANIAGTCRRERLDQFFVRVERGYQVAKSIRRW